MSMLPEISLNLLDIAQNSIKAGANCVRISLKKSRAEESLLATVEDDGCGMDEETVRRVVDPFYTTRTTRKVGLGIPFFKQGAEMTGGSFSLESQPGVGTRISAKFCLSHIDCMPLGEMDDTLLTLIRCNPDLRIVYTYQVDDTSFTLDTDEIREILGGVPLQTPEVMNFLREYLSEQTKFVERGASEQ